MIQEWFSTIDSGGGGVMVRESMLAEGNKNLQVVKGRMKATGWVYCALLRMGRVRLCGENRYVSNVLRFYWIFFEDKKISVLLWLLCSPYLNTIGEFMGIISINCLGNKHPNDFMYYFLQIFITGLQNN